MSIAQINPGLLLFAVALPLLVAVGMARRGWRGGLTRLAPWAALPALAAVFVAPNGVESSSSWLFLGSRMGLDQTGRIFLLFTSGLWWLSGVFAQHYLVSDPGRARFFVFHLLAMSGNFGLILAQDMVTFYVGFSLMSFASYGLVIHNGDRDTQATGQLRAARVPPRTMRSAAADRRDPAVRHRTGRTPAQDTNRRVAARRSQDR